jgi:hypothetical protein
VTQLGGVIAQLGSVVAQMEEFWLSLGIEGSVGRFGIGLVWGCGGSL